MDKLREAILAIDWEISDNTLDNFKKIVSDLAQQSKNFKIHHIFLKIINSTGQYIAKNRANSDKSTIAFLCSVFGNFELIVKTPGMGVKEKQTILENNINNFHKFKRKIARKRRKIRSAQKAMVNTPVQPALSHINKTSSQGENKVIPLIDIPESDMILENKKKDADNKIIRHKSPADPEDVMDNIFSTKKSPADELLDAIHLLDFQGVDTNQGQNILELTKDVQPAGVTKFIPKRINKASLPEIDNRLDEFFNLDDDNDDQIEPDSAADMLNQLCSTIEQTKWFEQESCFLSVKHQILFLKKTWQDDPEKSSLVQIIESLTTRYKEHAQKARDKGDENVSRPWRKIKGMFIS